MTQAPPSSDTETSINGADTMASNHDGGGGLDLGFGDAGRDELAGFVSPSQNSEYIDGLDNMYSNKRTSVATLKLYDAAGKDRGDWAKVVASIQDLTNRKYTGMAPAERLALCAKLQACTGEARGEDPHLAVTLHDALMPEPDAQAEMHTFLKRHIPTKSSWSNTLGGYMFKGLTANEAYKHQYLKFRGEVAQLIHHLDKEEEACARPCLLEEGFRYASSGHSPAPRARRWAVPHEPLALASSRLPHFACMSTRARTRTHRTQMHAHSHTMRAAVHAADVCVVTDVPQR